MLQERQVPKPLISEAISKVAMAAAATPAQQNMYGCICMGALDNNLQTVSRVILTMLHLTVFPRQTLSRRRQPDTLGTLY